MTDFTSLGLIAPQTRRPIPGGPESVADLLDVPSDPDRDCIVGMTRTLSYADTTRKADAAAAALLALGLEPGDRVAATGASDAGLVIAFLACMRAGLVWVGMNVALSPAEKAYQVETTGARLVLADGAELGALAEHLKGATLIALDGAGPGDWPALVRAQDGATRPAIAIDPHAPAAIAFTSGTTGRPKGAVHSQHNMMCIARAGHALIGTGNWTPGLRRAVPLPFTILNIMIYGVVDAMAGGGTLVCFARNDIKSIHRRIASERVEALGLAPAQLYDLVLGPDTGSARLGSLKYVWCGGSYVPVEIKDAFRRIYGCEVVEDYGLTEAPTSIVAGRVDQTAPAGAAGRPHPHLEVRALDAQGRPLADGAVGELAVRATGHGDWAGVFTPMLGYWRNPEATAATIRDGWLLTGDLGRIDDGWLSIVGRSKDIIVRGGANIYPAEVERVLRADKRLLDVVLVGMPDPRLGEIAAAFLELPADLPRQGLRAELEERCRAALAQYKVPERWFVVSSIPRNQMRKPLKADLMNAPRESL
ncbi:MAG: class I adenylate-forming enzyme family protein [Sagittula sp.]|uniref:class I adenylate-forming enzyme family protein n=1 Tax=Sagittula sp. TaxID=2038081 RepID=UPI0040598700